MKYLLTISKDYWNTLTSESIAKDFSTKLSTLINIPPSNIHYLIGNDVTLLNVKNTLYTFIKTSLLNSTKDSKLYIYINGHGNQVPDSNGDELIQQNYINESPIDNNDEIYQLPDGNLIDDELTEILDKAVYDSGIQYRPFIFLISDHCSSGSMLDKTQRYFDWASIGSSLDYQDSFVTGDGNVMTWCLINVLYKHKDTLPTLTAFSLFTLLHNEMKNSFIGQLQSPTFHISHTDIEHFLIF